MKLEIYFLIALFCILFKNGNSQEIDFKSNYRLQLGMNISECDDNGNNPRNEVFARKGFIFTIEGKIDDNFIISFLKWEIYENQINSVNLENNRIFYENSPQRGNYSTRKFFLMPIEVFKNTDYVQKVIGNGFTFGSLTVPIKVRFSNNSGNLNSKRYSDFEGNINLGFAAGFRFTPSERGTVQNIIGGVSLTQIPLDAINTNKYLDPDVKINGSGVSFYLSYLAEIKGFQFGAFLGKDFLGKEIGSKWIYNNKAWFGIGIGLNIFNNENKSNKQ